MRQEKEAAWNGGALKQHRRCRLDSRCLHLRCCSGLCINGREPEEVFERHLLAYCVRSVSYLGGRLGYQGEGRVEDALVCD